MSDQLFSTRHAQRGRWVARCAGLLLLALASRVAAGELAPEEKQPPRLVPGGPASAFAAVGNGGQYVLIVPTRDLVLVRLGELQEFEKWKELVKRIAKVVAAFPGIWLLGWEEPAPLGDAGFGHHAPRRER